MKAYNKALKFSVDFKLRTNLMLRSGLEGEFTDSSVEKTFDGKLHINGYVWAGLLRRALGRLNNGGDIAKKTDKYKAEDNGVSPLWCEASFAELPDTDVRPGSRIDRKYGTVATGALYSDEVAPPGIAVKLDFNYFLADGDNPDDIKAAFISALAIINDGIENIGGGWSYGHGRLSFDKAHYELLDLKDPEQRKRLWSFERKGMPEVNTLPVLNKEDISGPWQKYTLKARILDGQLLAVHTSYPLFQVFKEYPDLPDAFVYRRYRLNGGGKIEAEVVLPGKSIRQALFSVPIERKLRTGGEVICLDSTKSHNCTCKRCRWFGSTDKGGIIAVLDAEVKNPDTVVLNRIQLCEHSMQNMNLFNGEYLKKGEFEIEIIIDYSRDNSEHEELVKELKWILGEMKGDSDAPPCWYRMGATSTCTGQVEIVSLPPELETTNKEESKGE